MVALSPSYRDAALAALAGAELDVLVIGGGVVGAGCALDAVTRGLTVGLVEARDFASGTSSRYSKLIHGGLRYLEMLDFGLVREALRERGLILQRLAPHLARPVRFLYPLQHRGWERLYAGAGVTLYDTMARSGALQYYDAQLDDARHTMFLARTAAAYGAHVASRTEVIGFLREGERVTGVRVRDLEHDRTFEIRAQQVINATGVWTDDTQSLVGERGQFHVRASKGIHLVVPRDRIQSSTGLILRTASSVLFVIPWGRHWIVGTTDTDWALDKAHPASSSKDIDYLLSEVNKVLSTPLERADVQGVYAGLRPLLSGESESTSKLSREHSVGSPQPGLVVVAGGKYTTYRVMARDAVDTCVHGLSRTVPRSVTAEVPLLGAEGYSALWNRRGLLAAESGLHVARIEHLLGRYGTLTVELLALIRDDPDLARPIEGADDYLRAEFVYAASAEGARHLVDVLTRRTRISIETFDRGVVCAAEAAELMGRVLGWTPEQREREVQNYRLRVEAERASQEQQDDEAADATRLGAPEVVPVRLS